MEKPQETFYFHVNDISPRYLLSLLRLQSLGRNPFLFIVFFSIGNVIWDIFNFRMFTYAATLQIRIPFGNHKISMFWYF